MVSPREALAASLSPTEIVARDKEGFPQKSCVTFGEVVSTFSRYGSVASKRHGGIYISKSLKIPNCCSTISVRYHPSADWAKVRWALRVWSFWPGLAELEIKPQDVMPAAEWALSGALQPIEPSCQLAQLVLRLFLLCGMGSDQRYRALQENGETLLGEVSDVVQRCHVAGIIESGWPLFSLLALLRRGIQVGDGAGRRSSWVKRLDAAWRSTPKVGPPPPDQDILYASPKRRGSWMAGKRRPPRPSRAGRQWTASSLSSSAASAARAAASQESGFQYLYLSNVEMLWKRHLHLQRSESSLLEFLSYTWPACQSLSLLETAVFAQSPVSTTVVRHPAHLTAAWQYEVAGKAIQCQNPPVRRHEAQGSLRSSLQRQLAGVPLSEVWRRTRPLRGLRGSVLPSEAFFFHSLADLQGAQVIVESGVGNGGSTRAACAWAKAVTGRRVLALERALQDSVAQNLAPVCHGVLEMRSGDAFEALDWALQSAGAVNSSVALLLDGPKGRVAVRMAEDALRRYPGLSVAAIHDVPRLDPRYRDEEGRHLTRVAMEASPCLPIFSDEPWYVANFARQIDVDAQWDDDSTRTGRDGSPEYHQEINPRPHSEWRWTQFAKPTSRHMWPARPKWEAPLASALSMKRSNSLRLGESVAP
eukprot:symbB.v1.2.033277.t1/scaffold4110.1/size46135/2